MAGRAFSMWSGPVWSWALYDFANTIFSFVVVSSYFNEWVLGPLNGRDLDIGLMDLLLTVLLVLTMPFLGAVADQFGVRKPFLIFFTMLCVGATCGLALLPGQGVLIGALVLGGIAIFAFESALSHYDPLLAEVAPVEHRGRVSGLGVSIGYIGVLFAIFVLRGIVGEDGSQQQAFLPTAAMYVLFALPCFFLVREQRRRRVDRGAFSVAADAGRELRMTLRRIGEHRDVLRFLLARMLYVDALMVVIQFFRVYMKRLDFGGASTMDMVQVLAILSAAAGALAAGFMVERHGPRRVLVVVLGMVVAALSFAGLSGAPQAIWVLAPVIGIGLGSVWTSDRVFMLRLSPPAARGEFFGIYGLVGRVSGAIGPLLWGLTVYVAHELLGWSLLSSSRAAIVIMAVSAGVGLLIVRPIPDAERAWEDDLLERDLERGAVQERP